MKIVQVEDFFHPSAGYQVNVLSKYFVRSGNEVVIICGVIDDKTPSELLDFFGSSEIIDQDAEYENENNVKIIRLPVYRYISHRAVFGKELYRVINDEEPDILFAHDNDTLTSIRLILRYGKKHGFKIISDNHMLEMAATNCFSRQFRAAYRKFITPKIIKNKITVIRTQDDDYVEKCLGIPLSQCPYIPLGSDVLLFHKNKKAKSKFRGEHNISEDALVFVYAGKLDEAKGADILARAIHEKFESARELCFLIVGNTAREFGTKIERVFSDSKNRIIRLPTQTYPDLAKFYQSSDVAIFPRQCSLSFYDVQACGLPVISEDNNINIERNSHGNGVCFRSGDAGDLRKKIQEMVDMRESEYSVMSHNSEQYILKYFNYADTAQKYLDEMERNLKAAREIK